MLIGFELDFGRCSIAMQQCNGFDLDPQAAQQKLFDLPLREYLMEYLGTYWTLTHPKNPTQVIAGLHMSCAQSFAETDHFISVLCLSVGPNWF